MEYPTAFDRPLDDISRDRMARSSLVQSITRSLIVKEHGRWRSLQNVVGVTGSWGSGKSSILNFVANYIDAFEGTMVIRFEPWLISSETDIIDSFLREIARKIGADRLDKAKSVANELDRYRSALAGVADYAFPGAGMIARFLPRFRKATLNDQRMKLSRKLKNFDGAIVVVIDELDRVERNDVREVAKLVNSIAAIPGISFLLGYDYRRVSQILSTDGDSQSGDEYLKKIVQLNIPLRGMFDYEMERQLEVGIGRARIEKLKEYKDRWSQALSVCSVLIENPRDVKRICLAYDVLASAVGNEVDVIDAFCYSVISASSQRVLSAIHDHVDRIVVDPSRYDIDFISEMMADREAERNILERIGLPSADFDKFERVLDFMFPRENRKDVIQSFGRVLERKNLFTLIFLGNPPFRLSRSDIEGFWVNPSLAKLEGFRDAQTLADFTTQIGKLFVHLPREFDHGAFGVFVEWLRVGPPDRWLEGRRFANNLEEMLIAGAQSFDGGKARSTEIFDFVVGHGDTLLAASLIRHHMFAYGLAGDPEPRDYATIWSKDEFLPILWSELERYGKAVLDGSWITSFRDADPFYALVQGGAWKDEHREALEAAIQSSAGSSVFAALFAPPGYSFSQGTMALFLDEEKMLVRLREPDEPDAFLRRCRDRVVALSEGKHWSDIE